MNVSANKTLDLLFLKNKQINGCSLEIIAPEFINLDSLNGNKSIHQLIVRATPYDDTPIEKDIDLSSLNNLPSLKIIFLGRGVREIGFIKNLTSIKKLTLRFCNSLDYVDSLKNLREVSIIRCIRLTSLDQLLRCKLDQLNFDEYEFNDVTFNQLIEILKNKQVKWLSINGLETTKYLKRQHIKKIESIKGIIKEEDNGKRVEFSIADDNNRYVPLIEAINKGDKSEVESLIRKGADINLTNIYGDTPLNVAASGGYKEIVEFLVSHGADLNLSSLGGDTPLKNAVENGHKEIVEILVSNGADLNIPGFNEYTPLCMATSKGHKGIVEILVSNGADLNIVELHSGETPLSKAARNGHKEIVEILVSHKVDLNMPDKTGETPLYKAALRGHKEIVEILVSHGADINIATHVNSTALTAAAKGGYKEIVEILASQGAV